MTEMQLRLQVAETAAEWLGCKESDGSHRTIIDVYNSHEPLARGYEMQYTDAWCAAFVSAVAISCELTDIMPTECSCSKMIELYKALGRWEESDNYVPSVGDIVMYDWDDDGQGDNNGAPEHVGIVSSVTPDRMEVIEGNYNNAVVYRDLQIDGKYIRGYCLPDYASIAEEPPAEEPATIKGKWRWHDALERPTFEIDENVNFEFRCTYWVGEEEKPAVGKGDRIYTARAASADPQWSLRYNYAVYIEGESSEDPPVEAIAVYGGGNKNAWLYYAGEDIGYHIVDFGDIEQTVSAGFAAYVTANADPVADDEPDEPDVPVEPSEPEEPDVSNAAAVIRSAGKIVASLLRGQTAKLRCKGNERVLFDLEVEAAQQTVNPNATLYWGEYTDL